MNYHIYLTDKIQQNLHYILIWVSTVEINNHMFETSLVNIIVTNIILNWF